jgi:hypothetical protein
MMLLSQRDINHAGVMHLRVSKWAKRCITTTEDDIRERLDILTAAAYVVIDEYTEELLVRSFLRNDGIVKQPNMVKAALRMAEAVESPMIRRTLADEIERLDEQFAKLPKVDVQEEARATVRLLRGAAGGHHEPPPTNPSGTPREPLGNPSVSPPGLHQTGQSASLVKANRNPSGTPREGSGVGEGVRGSVAVGINSSFKDQSKTCAPSSASDHEPLAEPDTGQPPELTLIEPLAREEVVPIRRKADETFARFWAAYPRKKAKQEARKAWDKAIKAADPERIIAAAQQLTDSRPDLKYTPYPATWLNRESWDDEPDSPSRYQGYREADVDESVYRKGLLP